MKKKIKISVVTVAFNAEEYIEETINSIINQTYKDIEYIIIDGGSTDKTVYIINKYISGVSKYITEKDKGIYDAMNKGIKNANGDFLIFMNASDKFINEYTIEKIVNQITGRDTLYFGNAVINSANNKTLYPLEKDKKNIKKWLKHHTPNHQCVFYPRSYYSKNRYLDLKFYADGEYTDRAIESMGWEYININIAEFRIGGVSNRYDNFNQLLIKCKESYVVLGIHSKKYGRYYKYFGVIKNILKYINQLTMYR